MDAANTTKVVLDVVKLEYSEEAALLNTATEH